MGNLIWHEYARYVTLTATVYTVWASFWALFYRKFFWDFIGGIVRTPGGIQPANNVSIFITLIVKAPIIPILSMILGFSLIALEYPLPLLKKSPIYRSFVVRIVALLIQAFLAVLYYQEIIASLPERFDKAREAGDLLFFPSSIRKLTEDGIEFEVRLCPALQQKPTLPTPHFEEAEAQLDKQAKKSDPFTPPYVPALHLGDLKDKEEGIEYAVLFNKYSVVPHHILLVTKVFHSQTAPLLPPDLVQAYLLLDAARKAGRRFFAFYNCGDRSGASQPHKHLQLVPIEDDGPPVERLARAASLEVDDRPFALEALPYANHIRRLPNNLTSLPVSERERILSHAFLSLLDLAISTVRHDPNYPPGSPSYNVLLTLEHMYVIPRRCESHVLQETGESLSVNALGFAGLLLVKSEGELEAVRKESVKNILKCVALESVHDQQVDESYAEAE
ncbi:hypothetical protein OBBRIDRAFT_818769 [Obba rivulosa]|uniref:ATP adenylyltransferase n=1 Tax=Obba rivulosa TaxID=1052685 RepID=A0A8E2DNU1_9APHY|nr:hypothetical protein OBBRIDRAFT_818769 [Obba rivulosa]